MSPRRARIRKIVDLRERELEKQATNLSRARRAVEAASAREAAEAKAREHARRARSALAEAPIDGETWRQTNEWLQDRETYHEAAMQCLRRSREAASRAHEQVLAARAALKRLQVLDQRLSDVERADEARLENKLHDEVAAQRARRR
jgi:flagellar export protein FliJ